MLKTTYRILSVMLKASITLAAIGYVVLRLRGESVHHWQQMADFATSQWLLFALAVLLIPANWGLEALKWWWMVRRYYPEEPFLSCFQSVIAGITTGIFTPNRLGEYAGRILYLAPGHRAEAVMMLLLDRAAQMLVTLLMGSAALWLMVQAHENQLIAGLNAAQIPFRAEWLPWCYAALLAVNVVVLAGIFNPRVVHGLLWKFPLQRFPLLAKASDALLDINPHLLAKILLMGAARSLIFTFQYILLMWMLGYTGSFSLALGMIWVIFFIKSAIPSVALSELGVRESTALLVMGIWQVPDSVAFSSTFLLYVLNIILPALIGTIFVQRMKIR